jgi:protein translocase SecG subunit
MQDTISIIQIIVSVALIVLILLQQRDSDTAGFLGGGGGGGTGVYQQRRGLDRLFFTLTIILAVVFAGLALTSLLYAPGPVAPVEAPNATSTPAAASGAPVQP